ncbi:hemerythrin domain-containing protein [Pontivivens insulae]|uniref:Hemerythrin-like domain-containing protein n=1 Tax=Pontivivens insulae TaxID=1639689 RepID=A0A2R8AAG7_9RHOB|nr:hemerythrin domain-containing protein [Pontivivens insulae]RED13122.1 hemerythrin HHE cation binding domain-containing protein [Pontivivens insulae]SPF29214.1 hypothetical protein POI8812_01521 [Pontivivens insulae]
MSDPLALAERNGLPDALRVLAEQYPRADWETHHNFTALTRFWLDRHLMFRRGMAELVATNRALLEGTLATDDAKYRLARVGQFMLQDLHGHHMIEDTQYFPVLMRQDNRLLRGFEMLDKDHHAIDAVLGQFADGANGLLQAQASGTIAAAEQFAATLEKFQTFLARHLEDEEELVVPVLLEYAPSEFDH